MKTTARPCYVFRSNEQAFAPPYRQAGCKLYGFWLRASMAQLQLCCDRFFTQPSHGAVRVHVAAPFVLLYFCSFAQSQSLHESDRERGWLGENECGLWIPVTYQTGATTPALGFFPVQLFVDSGPAAISGREVLGFPKEIAHITLPSAASPPALFLLHALTFARSSQDSAGRWSKLVELRKSDDDTQPRLALGLRDVLPLLRRLWPLRKSRGRVPLLLFKQIRDAMDPALACHQSILACTPEPTGVRALRGLPGRYQIELHDCESHPLRESLGIEPAALRGARGFYLDFDFTLGRPELLWEAR